MSFFNLFKPDVENLQRNRDVNGLIEALKNRDEHTRAHASYALGEIRAHEAIDPLIAVVLTDAPLVRYEAARSLGILNDPKAIPALIENFKYGVFCDPLSNNLTDAYGNPYTGSKNIGSTFSDVHNNAKAALVDFGETAVLPLLNVLNDKSPFVRAFAANVLGVIKDQRALEPLCNLMTDNHSFVRGAVVWSLGNFGGEKAIQCLKNAEKIETDYYIKRDIGDTLRRIK